MNVRAKSLQSCPTLRDHFDWSLAGYSRNGHQELDMTEATEHERIVQVSIQEPQVTDVG